MTPKPDTRTEAQIVFDEMSARQLSECVRVLARDRGLQVAAVTVLVEERGGLRIVVCAPCAQSERDFGTLVARTVAAEVKATAADIKAERDIDYLAKAVAKFLGRGVLSSTPDAYSVARASWEELGRALDKVYP